MVSPEKKVDKRFNPKAILLGNQLREEIIQAGPIFLNPSLASNEEESLQALSTVLIAYALGSRTAEKLVMEKQQIDPSWTAPPREKAIELVIELHKLKQYLPYILTEQKLKDLYKSVSVNFIKGMPAQVNNKTVKDKPNNQTPPEQYDPKIMRQKAKTMIGYTGNGNVYQVSVPKPQDDKDNKADNNKANDNNDKEDTKIVPNPVIKI